MCSVVLALPPKSLSIVEYQWNMLNHILECHPIPVPVYRRPAVQRVGLFLYEKIIVYIIIIGTYVLYGQTTERAHF